MTDMTGAPLGAPLRGTWRALAAAIACVTVFGLSVGLSVPLLSLLLDERGVNPVLTGLNAGAAFIGVLLGPLLTAPSIRRIGVRPHLILCLALDIVVFLALRVFQGLGAWFVLRMALGLIGSGIFTASEAWINRLAGDANRGRVVGAYAAALGAGFGLGPLLLWLTGIAGWAPFIANGAIGLAAMIPLMLAGGEAARLSWDRPPSPFRMIRRAPFLLFAVAMFGFYETSAMAILPLWGVRIGLTPTEAAGTISAIYFGTVVLQVPLGAYSDRAGRRAALLLCAGVGVAGAALLPLAADHVAGLAALLLVWGGLASGIYPIALGIAGDRFRGGELLSANAALVMAYGTGSLAGPFLGGAALDAWSPGGFPAFLATVFLGLGGVTLVRRRD